MEGRIDINNQEIKNKSFGGLSNKWPFSLQWMARKLGRKKFQIIRRDTALIDT